MGTAVVVSDDASLLGLLGMEQANGRMGASTSTTDGIHTNKFLKEKGKQSTPWRECSAVG